MNRCDTCHDSGHVREVWDAGWCFTPALRHEHGAKPCPDCVSATCEARGLTPHSEDKFALCPCCRHYAVQVFNGAYVGLSDDETRKVSQHQFTCSREACANTWSEAHELFNQELPELTVLERRCES